MKNLISMVDFLPKHPYSIFLKQALELWMFVPCDEDGNVIEHPKPMESDLGNLNYHLRFNQYQQAKERCLFEGFRFLEGNKKVFHVENKKGSVGVGFRNGYYKTVEEIISTETTLTESAIKQLGL